ncbi:MAG: methyltransferase domain-containing protein [Chloroflexota bacterium]
MSAILDIGCGNAKTPGALGIDANPQTQADIIHDLDQFPWPLPSDEFDQIVCSHIVEHVADMMRFMAEVHRVARPQARVAIITPHFSNRFSFTDPTHRRHLSLRSFDYFLPPAPFSRPNLIQRALETKYAVPNFYTDAHFAVVSARVSMARPFRLTGVQWLTNRFPDFYELYLAFMLPARDLYFTLQVVK